MFKNRSLSLVLALIITLSLSFGPAAAQGSSPQAATPVGTAFTYQGQLKDGSGNPVNATCAFNFSLWDSLTGGTQIGTTQNKTGVAVSNGLFTVALDFGASAFTGSARWLDIQVKCGSDSGFTTLSPRQQLTPAPYSLYAVNAGTAASLSSVLPLVHGGTGSATQNFVDLSTAQSVAGVKTFTNAPSFSASGVPFSVTGTGKVTNLNADLLDGQHANALQSRVSGTCAVGSSIRAIHADGTVDCERPVTMYTPLYQLMWLNLATSDSALKGFVGGFTDGDYAYFVPNNNGALSGDVARVDLHNYTTSGVTSLDLAAVTRNPLLKGFYGGLTDGIYGYFVPNSSPWIARVKLWDFSAGGVSAWNLAAGGDSDLQGFRGGFTDGGFNIYLVPNGNGGSGKIVRLNTLGWGSTDAVTVLDLSTIFGFLRGFNGGFTDGHYGYFVPYYWAGGYHGFFVRVDLSNFTTSGVTVLNLSNVDSGLAGFTSGFTDGRYGYLVPYYNNGDYSGKVARVDLSNFTESGVTVLDLAAVNSNLKGFAGGFTDGHYGYFVPSYYGVLARVDLANFTTSGVTTQTSWLSSFGGGFTDGRYGYLVPNNALGTPDGGMARIQLFSGVGGP